MKVQIEGAIERSFDPDPRVRALAVTDLCPCRVQANVEPVWERLLELARDEDAKVRRAVLHNLTDGSPRAIRDRVTLALEAFQQDPDPKLRRHARNVMASYRRTGRIDHH